ncbi:two-component system, OmpR family, heavy metal sensor histidine kinase CusS [Cupriavidus metallidurans]|jgi:two-component system heavy metal sensor histidine kinase CusS|uniref:heavy metal sensor histidine kinase n=1 Tax=Cupriavidus TaxID=106589 RepID=UPI0004934BB6|nr:heavy metal sensor histidine kinase [Cupriavidus metallidurans]AVA35887.1 HAMP domain-containing protein [Cupriavidus metallidurans]MDE4917968.1 heavy metal sensor histidine kinase [Cupriavidus metallidurans]
MRKRSLTARLALAFALIAGLTFSGVGIYLYGSLASQIIDRDDAELLRKAARAQQELAELRSSPTENRWEEVLGVVKGNEEFGIRILDARGVQLAAAGANYGIKPIGGGAYAKVPDAAGSIQAWSTPSDMPVRMTTIKASVSGEASPVVVELYQVASSRVSLLRDYRWKLFIAVLLGTVGAGGLGYAALRAGMAPLRSIAAGTASVTFTSGALPVDPSRLPAELDDLARALQRMIDRLRERYDRLSQFSADLAHDFRTPITNLLGQTQVALSSDRSIEEYQSLLVSNVEEYERLSRMIENMLFLARADNARVAILATELDLREELHRQADYFESLAEARQITIQVNAQGKVFADPTLFRRALSNLLSNAIRYANEGTRVTVHGRHTGGVAQVKVENVGPGIAPEHLSLLFDRFFRADPARANSGESSGIGLAIVKTIMDLHHGAVSVRSVLNATTSFQLEFPDNRTIPHT